jgi:hypothetical protein
MPLGFRLRNQAGNEFDKYRGWSQPVLMGNRRREFDETEDSA